MTTSKDDIYVHMTNAEDPSVSLDVPCRSLGEAYSFADVMSRKWVCVVHCVTESAKMKIEAWLSK